MFLWARRMQVSWPRRKNVDRTSDLFHSMTQNDTKKFTNLPKIIRQNAKNFSLNVRKSFKNFYVLFQKLFLIKMFLWAGRIQFHHLSEKIPICGQIFSLNSRKWLKHWNFFKIKFLQKIPMGRKNAAFTIPMKTCRQNSDKISLDVRKKNYFFFKLNTFREKFLRTRRMQFSTPPCNFQEKKEIFSRDVRRWWKSHNFFEKWTRRKQLSKPRRKVWDKKPQTFRPRSKEILKILFFVQNVTFDQKLPMDT